MTAVFVDVFCPLVALRYVSAFGAEDTKTYLRGYCYTNRKKLLDCAGMFACSWLRLLSDRSSTFCGRLGADLEFGVASDLK